MSTLLFHPEQLRWAVTTSLTNSLCFVQAQFLWSGDAQFTQSWSKFLDNVRIDFLMRSCLVLGEKEQRYFNSQLLSRFTARRLGACSQKGLNCPLRDLKIILNTWHLSPHLTDVTPDACVTPHKTKGQTKLLEQGRLCKPAPKRLTPSQMECK